MPDHNFVRLTFGDFFGAFIKKEKKFLCVPFGGFSRLSSSLALFSMFLDVLPCLLSPGWSHKSKKASRQMTQSFRLPNWPQKKSEKEIFLGAASSFISYPPPLALSLQWINFNTIKSVRTQLAKLINPYETWSLELNWNKACDVLNSAGQTLMEQVGQSIDIST